MTSGTKWISLHPSKGLLRSYFANFHYERFLLLDNWQSVNTSTSSGFAAINVQRRSSEENGMRPPWGSRNSVVPLDAITGWQGRCIRSGPVADLAYANPLVENRSSTPSFEVLPMHPRPSLIRTPVWYHSSPFPSLSTNVSQTRGYSHGRISYNAADYRSAGRKPGATAFWVPTLPPPPPTLSARSWLARNRRQWWLSALDYPPRQTSSRGTVILKIYENNWVKTSDWLDHSDFWPRQRNQRERWSRTFPQSWVWL